MPCSGISTHALAAVPASFAASLPAPPPLPSPSPTPALTPVPAGAVALAAITSCTNTANPAQPTLRAV